MAVDIDTFLDELYQDGCNNDSKTTDRAEMRFNITPGTGRFLALLIAECKPQRILEIGTSNGYSTIWIARAAQAIGASVTSVDRSEEKTAAARRNLETVRLTAVSLITQDATDFLKQAPTDGVDFLFLDSTRSYYVDWWEDIRRVLAWGNLVVDNALSHPDEMQGLLDLVRHDPNLDQIVLPIGKGQLLVTSSRQSG